MSTSRFHEDVQRLLMDGFTRLPGCIGVISCSTTAPADFIALFRSSGIIVEVKTTHKGRTKIMAGKNNPEVQLRDRIVRAQSPRWHHVEFVHRRGKTGPGSVDVYAHAVHPDAMAFTLRAWKLGSKK